MTLASHSIDVVAGVSATGTVKRSAASAKTAATPQPDWRAQFAARAEPRVVAVKAAGGPARMLQPTPQVVAEEVALVPAGAVLTLSALGDRLARRFRADRCSLPRLRRCLEVVAGVVADDLRRDRPARWPIWRVTNDNGQLPGSWPLDARWRAAVLRGEGRQLRYGAREWLAASDGALTA